MQDNEGPWSRGMTSRLHREGRVFESLWAHHLPNNANIFIVLMDNNIMVDAAVLRKIREHLERNLENYILKRPGYFVFLEQNCGNIKESFYPDKKSLDKAIKKYHGLYEPTFLTEKIPKKTHRFRPCNIKLEFAVYEHVTVCPNDGKTKLVGLNGVMLIFYGESYRHEERAYCPDCLYRVFRMPS